MSDWSASLRHVISLPEGASTFADEIDTLHGVVLAIQMLGVGAIAVFTACSIAKYSRKRPAVDSARVRTAHPAAEVFVIGGILTLFVVIWIVGFVQFIAMRTPPADADEVYVTAKQWMWKFAYPDGTATVGALIVPRDRPIRLVMSSRDVIHSFYVPAFRVKHDVVPGRTTIAWFEATKAGRFPIRCAEMCGRDHARMAAEVIVLEPDAYTAWKDAATDVEFGEARPSMAEQGRAVAAEKECLACHTIDGTAHIGPTWVGLYGSPVRLTDGRVVLADEAYLTRSMMDPDVDITAGFQPLMPSFQGRLTNWEAASLVELIRSLRDGAPAREVTP